MNPGGWQKVFQYKGKKVISNIGGPDLQDDLKNMAKFIQEVGIGSCSLRRYSELNEAMQDCSTDVERSSGLESASVTGICSMIAPMFECYELLGECYTTKELNRLKEITLEFPALCFELVPMTTVKSDEGSVKTGNNL